MYSNISVAVLLLFAVSLGFSAPISSRNAEAREEAIKIALESSNELIVDSSLVDKIQSDLRLIRSLDKSLLKRTHAGKWHPGQVITKSILSNMQIKQVEESEFKPVKIQKGNKGSLLLIFKKPYHPEKLGRLLKLRFGFDSKPNFIRMSDGGKDEILYRHDLSTYFWNSVNSKNCLEGCAAQYSVSFSNHENDVF